MAEQCHLGRNEEIFQKFESKIDEVTSLLNSMTDKNEDMTMSSTDSETKNPLKIDADGRRSNKGESIGDDFIVKISSDRTIINKIDSKMEHDGEMTQFQFMQEVERDAARRANERKNRESVAANMRKLGNEAFRKCDYERALCMYNKAIDHIKDSPILYNNRALTYIRLRLYKKAIIDADFVIQKLDEKNIRSWLYRAKSYLLLGMTQDFEKSVNEAKKNNPKQLDFIDRTVNEIKIQNQI